MRVPLRDKHGEVVAHALVDAEDWPAVSAWAWCMHSRGYAKRGVRVNGKNRVVLLHRFILGLEHGDRTEVDHINRDGLDCRRENLRVVPHVVNVQNVTPRTGGTSAHRGVSWSARRQRWCAQGRTATARLSRFFATEQEAADAARAWRLAHMPGAMD